MSQTLKWIISGVLFFVAAYFLYSMYLKGIRTTSSHKSSQGTTGGGAGSGGVKESEKK